MTQIQKIQMQTAMHASLAANAAGAEMLNDQVLRLLEKARTLGVTLDGAPARAEAKASKTAYFLRIVSAENSAVFPLRTAEVAMTKSAGHFRTGGDQRNLGYLIRG